MDRELWKVVALRDVNDEFSKKFDEISETEQNEIFQEIIEGYSNPYRVAEIVFSRYLALKGDL